MEPYREGLERAFDSLNKESVIHLLAAFIETGGQSGSVPQWFLDHEISVKYKIPLKRDMTELSAIDKQRCLLRMGAYSIVEKRAEVKRKLEADKNKNKPSSRKHGGRR